MRLGRLQISYGKRCWEVQGFDDLRLRNCSGPPFLTRKDAIAAAQLWRPYYTEVIVRNVETGEVLPWGMIQPPRPKSLRHTTTCSTLPNTRDGGTLLSYEDWHELRPPPRGSLSVASSRMARSRPKTARCDESHERAHQGTARLPSRSCSRHRLRLPLRPLPLTALPSRGSIYERNPMPSRKAEIRKNLKGPQGPRFGGPQGGRPTLASGQIKSLGIQPASKGEGKRMYIPGARGHSPSQGKAFGNLSVSPKGKRQIRRYGS